MADIRTKRTDRAVKDALLKLLETKSLANIGMTELAQEAGVSRSTLYTHYGNVIEVFQALVVEFSEEIRSLNTQLKCDSCRVSGAKRPFCMALRAAGPYQPLVLAPEFLHTYLEIVFNGPYLSTALEPYLATGVSEQQARALFTFQMTGCYTAATTMDDVLWEENQQAIDQFIRGGMSALRSKGL